MTLPEQGIPDTERPPVVGIVSDVTMAQWGVWNQRAAVISTGYLQALGRAGATPVILPPGQWSPDAAIARIDALVLGGGPDIDPARYGQPRGRRTDRPSTERDTWELRLLETGLKEDLPILAICRGMQMLNVACGGSLLQHLPDVVGHDWHLAEPDTFGSVPVRIDSHSRLAAAIGSTVQAPCHHHQAVDRLGRGLDAVAWAHEGSVEAVEHRERAFVVGVQWHAEVLLDTSLFAALVTAARAHSTPSTA